MSSSLVTIGTLLSDISLWLYVMLFQTHGDIATDDNGNSFRLMRKIINTAPLAWAKLLELGFNGFCPV